MTLLDVSHTLGVPTSTLLQMIPLVSNLADAAVQSRRLGVSILSDATVYSDAPYSMIKRYERQLGLEGTYEETKRKVEE